MDSEGGSNPFKRPLCWYGEHEWVDDGFMDGGQECARCGAWDDDLETADADDVTAFVAGIVVGVLLTSSILLWVIV